MTVNTLLLVLVLLAPAVPILNLCRHRSFLRRLSLFPRALLILAAVMLGYIVAIVVLAAFWPRLLLFAAAVVLPPAIYLFAWRARPGFGRSKGLPPGRLVIAPTGPWKDYLYYLKQAEQHGSIFKMCHFVQPMVCIVGLPAGKEFLLLNDNNTVTPPMPFNNSIPEGFMRYMAPDLHRAYRDRMKRVFSDREFLDRKLDRVSHAFRQGLLQMAEREEPVNPAPHIARMCFAIMAELFFGVSPGSERFERLRRCYSSIDYRTALTTSASSVEESLREIEKIVLDSAASGDHLFLQFIGNSPSAGQFQADNPTLLRNFIFLMLTSWIDVSDLLTWVFKLMNDHPGWNSRMCEALVSGHDFANHDKHQLATSIVLETLRLEQSEYLMRRAVRDIEFRGYRIPANWLVRICIRESHLDPEHFDRPFDFDPKRFLNPEPGRQHYAPFGMDEKSCLGTVITLWVGQQFVLEVAGGPDWRLVQDGPRELGAFHWRPSTRYRVRSAINPDAGRKAQAGI